MPAPSHAPQCDICCLRQVKKPGDICRPCRKRLNKNNVPGKGQRHKRNKRGMK
jgi:hypothetical protein